MGDDVPKEEGGYTWLWRTCCLERVREAFQMEDCPGSKNVATNYNWCFTRDVGALTVTGRARSMIRQGGLVYSQFYLMNKLQFDSTKHFPWDDEDDTMAALAIDSTYSEAIRATMGAKSINLRDCRTSYNHCGRRFMLGVTTNHNRSWGAREEHRVTLALLMAMNREFQSRGCSEIRKNPERRTQFHVIGTKLVNQFTKSVTLPLARWYQEVLGKAEEGMLGTDSQKLAILLSLLIKNSYSSALLSKNPSIWEGKRKAKKGNRPEVQGLGLKDVIKNRGFGWLSTDVFNWKSNSFAPEVANSFPYPVRSIEKRYHARAPERNTMNSILQEVDQIVGRVQSLQVKPKRRFLLLWLAMRIIRQYHVDVWVGLYASTYQFVRKEEEIEAQMDEQESSDSEAHRRRAPPAKKRRLSNPAAINLKKVKKSFPHPPGLTRPCVGDELGEDPYPCKRGRSHPTRLDIFFLLFLYQFVRKDDLKGGWKSLPYLHAFAAARTRLKQADFDWLTWTMWKYFERYCLCIPAVSKDRWLANSARSKSEPAWIGFDQDGVRMDYPDKPDGYAGKYGSTWHKDATIQDEYCWNVTCEEATSAEGLEKGARYYESLDRQVE